MSCSCPHETMTRRHARFIFLTALLMAGCSGGKDLSSPSAPVNPANTNLGVVWTGTLSRPAGFGTIVVQWNGSQDSNGVLSGPISMTYNGVTIQAQIDGQFGPSGAGTANFRMTSATGASPASPSCHILSNSQFAGFSTGTTTLTSDPFDVTYNDCAGFIANDPQRTQHIDT